MCIIINKQKNTFHLCNKEISYIMTVLPNGQMGQLYFGKRIKEREDYSHLLEILPRPMASCVYDTDKAFSMEHIKQEYGTFGATDYRIPAA
ncbi:MAG TPA: alpha-galactosidase, partial [Candidatus Mediterraneibacter stercoripullorum]|nr:alpha-galactosidase [Candidatus Mediterraneibacter stercoripullorum]